MTCVTFLHARQFSKRTVRVSKEMTEDAKTLLRLMGVPVIEAPTEAEAQCSALAKAGAVHAAVSEDMDTLTFGAPVMLRNVFGMFSPRPHPPLERKPQPARIRSRICLGVVRPARCWDIGSWWWAQVKLTRGHVVEHCALDLRLW